ncbi:VOC family protein [Sphingomonas sp. MG17]|uniref:VOC family protein n=1 Tax=Sphingomonas tagetis TaxID=2949092 RepID=A0A9X2KLA8_9SPHN|nr:VOC family protein [Sphingomonas tagetis]MCP3731349.1 VOC family protein [Sphingomonas tagetis]
MAEARFDAGKFTISHLGMYVQDLDMMVEFYTRTLGFVITDRGEGKGTQIVFLSRNSSDHHQLVLVAGRETSLDVRMIQQISFRVDSLEALKSLYPLVKAAPISDMQPVFHGISYSLYFRDPEGNRLEFFADTEWYVTQPCLEPLDLSLPAEQIRAEKKAFSESQPSYRPLKEWQAEFERKFSAV